MPQTVIFSDRAYTALLTETLKEIKTETGGIFLGHYNSGKWYIIESIDPGPDSIFSSAYFEYNEAYVNHLANKINVLYKNPLKIMGLWHRHPGSMDYFSSTDNSTHERYADINTFGVISALVNIDPSFRLSIYSITKENNKLIIPKTKLDYSVGSEKIPQEFLSYCPADILENKINSFAVVNTGSFVDVFRETSRGLKEKVKLMEKIVNKAFSSNHPVSVIGPVKMNDENIEEILKTLEEDISFFEEQGIQCGMSLGDDGIMRFYGEIEKGKRTCEVLLIMYRDDVYISYKGKTYLYCSGFFQDTNQNKRM